MFAQTITEQIPGWAQGSIALAAMAILGVIVRQMLATFESRTDKMLEVFKSEQSSERGRSDAHLEKVYQKLDNMSDRLYEARCRLPPGGCDFQRVQRLEQYPSPHKPA